MSLTLTAATDLASAYGFGVMWAPSAATLTDGMSHA